MIWRRSAWGRRLACAAGLAALASLHPAAGPEAAQSSWRTPWNDPDLQGTWTNATTTPLERPAELAGVEVLTEEQRAERDARVSEQISADRPPSQGDPGTYNEFWWDRGNLSLRTSLIIDPRDGRLPPLTGEAQQRAAERAAARRKRGPADSWEDLSLFSRCITRGVPGAMIPGFYNHNYHVLQTPDHVVIHVEMIHDVRIIPLDGRRPPAPHVRQWMGVSRGHWEGDTLVVETTNMRPEGTFRNADPETYRLVERFKRIDADTLDYQFTVADPRTFTTSFTVSTPMTKSPDPIFEYACHEGNYAMKGILAGAREEERAKGGTP